jgi:TPR repeat protein
MTVTEAHRIIDDFYGLSNASEEDVFIFTEALNYLIQEKNDPHAMMELGGWYYGKRQFDLALKYYEMAEPFGLDIADECLGYIWYYGRTGETDYDKAFFYFSKSAEQGHLKSKIKVADMYKNGYAVEKNYPK